MTSIPALHVARFPPENRRMPAPHMTRSIAENRRSDNLSHRVELPGLLPSLGPADQPDGQREEGHHAHDDTRYDQDGAHEAPDTEWVGFTIVVGILRKL
jgi:hypothetical protein